MTVTKSWAGEDSKEIINTIVEKFSRIWRKEEKGYIVFSASEAIKEKILKAKAHSGWQGKERSAVYVKISPGGCKIIEQ